MEDVYDKTRQWDGNSKLPASIAENISLIEEHLFVLCDPESNETVRDNISR